MANTVLMLMALLGVLMVPVTGGLSLIFSAILVVIVLKDEGVVEISIENDDKE